MKPFKSLLLLIAFLFTCLYSFATWSIIVIDAKTNEIGIAGASCTPSVYGIGAIVPGKGAVVVQAWSNGAARRKAVEMIKSGASPSDILTAIKDERYDPENQQYAILTSKYLDEAKTYTGKQTAPHNGALTAKGISVQGNILTNPDELKAILDAALKAQEAGLPIQEVLMAALEAGAEKGGDKRCGDIKASSAFVTVAKPNDDIKSPYLNLVVYGSDKRENAVAALRKKFNDWKSANSK